MAVLQVNYFSKVLGIQSDMNVILPSERKPDEKFPVLYLLHGHSDNHHAWMQRTSLLRYVEEMYPNLCVVMPAGDTSYYTDMSKGRRYYKHFTWELPRIIASMFPVSDRREDTFIAGLSMGGYGALKIALANPEKYAKAAAFSGIVDIADVFRDRVNDELWETFTLTFGDDYESFTGTINDTRHTLKVASDKGNVPDLLFCCGDQDFLFNNNLAYKEYMDSLDTEYTWIQDEGYGHTWDYWNICIQRALQFIQDQPIQS